MAGTSGSSRGESRRAGPQGRGAGGADVPAVEGVQDAAQRLVLGELIDDGLDAVTAKAVQLLAAADTIAASTRTMRPRRRWRDPGLWITVVAFACLVMLAASYMQLSVVAGNNHVLLREQVRQEHLLADCTTPGGQCFQRAQKQTAGAVQTLVIRLSVGMCRLVYPHADAAEIERCVTRVTKE